MNRELKFRAWSPEMACMSGKAKTFNGEEIAFTISGSRCFGVPKDAIVMQYTGLNDCNGKEIYEGDILVSESESNTVKVKWGNYKARLKGFPPPFDEFEMVGWLVENINDSRLVEPLDSSMAGGEVIGNIYENADLLTSKS